jgi:predicted branched-subunit amino acid permease
MAIRHEDDPANSRLAFWSTGIAIFVLWNIGTAIGALGASALDDPAVLGLDAAIPAGFIALLWPRLRDRESWAVALAGAVLALALTPVLPPGTPVLAAAIIPFLVVFVGRSR